MNKYEALMEDENDILGGSQKSIYWGMTKKMSPDVLEDEFDKIVQRLAVMESLLSQNYEYEALDNLIVHHYSENEAKIEELKKSVYMELGGKLIYRVSE
jgi:hypothetical protein